MTTHLKPVFRRLRGYAYDPSLSLQLDTVMFNETVFKIRWEENLEKGPIGEYLEVIDYDPASKRFYEPVDLNDPSILASDGLSPSESNPFFHQQMVYAVAMTTIQNFECALGRRVLWAGQKTYDDEGEIIKEDYEEKLRIYPHALRQANAFYSPQKIALLFGYFPASSDAPGLQMPGGMVFTCLSHDIIAHETTHALLDGMHRRFIEANHPDTLAFHEAFADIVALFQHFTFPEVLWHQIAKTRGDLESHNILGELAQQFGKAIGNYGALRNAIGKFNPETKKWELLKANPEEYLTVFEPHARGSLLVATIFVAFLSIYKGRIADLLRIASNGTGILPEGAIHPDLVKRLSDEAAVAAQHILAICIRALDYCPPVDITFGDYLRAIITADLDVVPDDYRNYRVAIIEAFRQRGIYPRDVRNLSVESLCWQDVRGKSQEIFSKLGEKPFREIKVSPGDVPSQAKSQKSNDSKNFGETLRDFMNILDYSNSRQEIYENPRKARAKIHGLIKQEIIKNKDKNIRQEFERLTGIICKPSEEHSIKKFRSDFGKLTGEKYSLKPEDIQDLETDKEGFYKFEIHSLRGARRNGQNGKQVNQVIVSITQKRKIITGDEEFVFRGGCTLILNLEDLKLQYIVKKPIDDAERLKRHWEFRSQLAGQSLQATYFSKGDVKEPFALLHGIPT